MRVRLKRDSLEADIAPRVGGAIAAFRRDGRDILRAAPENADDPTTMAEFPMGPYVNRITLGHVRWHGETFLLPLNFGDHPHPLHGIGWRSAWSCERLNRHAVRLRLARDADSSWPWRLTMERVIALSDSGLEIAFTLTNEDVRSMPASIGSHPFFPAPGAVVTLKTAAKVLTTDDGAPVRTAHTPAVDALAAGARAEDLALDHCFTGWDGRADIAWPTHTLHIETDPPQRFVQVFAPPGAGFFCVEPQSAAPDAVNREGSGVATLQPGEALTFTTRFVVAAR